MNTFPAAVRARALGGRKTITPRDNVSILNTQRRVVATADPKIPPARKIEWQLGGDELRLGLHQQPDAANDTIAAETTGEACVVVGNGYLAEIVGEIAGPSVKFESTDGTTPIPDHRPRRPRLAGAAGAHPLTDSATARGCPARRRGHSTGHSTGGLPHE